MKTSIRARRTFMVFAATAAIVLIAGFVILSDRYRVCYVGDSQINGCYMVYGQLVPGSGFAFRNKFFGLGIQNRQLTVAVRSTLKNSERSTEEEQQRYAERREQLRQRIHAKRDARRSGIEAFIARTGDPGNIAAKQPPN